MRGIEYKFRIDRFTPETLPMKRLAEYLGELAALFGNPDKVHFERVDLGSAIPVIWIDEDVEPQVAARVSAAPTAMGDEKARAAFEKINTLLREDGATGELRRPTGNVIPFPGRTLVLEATVGPITKVGSLQGTLVRIGGKDASVHGLLEDETRTWKFSLTRDLAKQMAPHLYSIIRVHGSGRWKREGNGQWHQVSFITTNFDVLVEAALDDVFQRLREIRGNDWIESKNPLKEVDDLRGED
jgi:hypothetical protein